MCKFIYLLSAVKTMLPISVAFHRPSQNGWSDGCSPQADGFCVNHIVADWMFPVPESCRAIRTKASTSVGSESVSNRSTLLPLAGAEGGFNQKNGGGCGTPIQSSLRSENQVFLGSNQISNTGIAHPAPVSILPFNSDGIPMARMR